MFQAFFATSDIIAHHSILNALQVLVNRMNQPQAFKHRAMLPLGLTD